MGVVWNGWSFVHNETIGIWEQWFSKLHSDLTNSSLKATVLISSVLFSVDILSHVFTYSCVCTLHVLQILLYYCLSLAFLFVYCIFIHSIEITFPPLAKGSSLFTSKGCKVTFKVLRGLGFLFFFFHLLKRIFFF